MGLAEISDYLGKLFSIQDLESTAWNEKKSSGVTVQESSSTTHPLNSRFSFVRNGNFFNMDEVDSTIVHDQPLYRFPLAANDVWVVGGVDRNPYVPGFESESGTSFQTSDPPQEGSYLPEDLNLIEAGYGTLYNQALTGVPNEDFVYSKEGGVLHIEDSDVDLRVYKGGDVANSLPLEDWEFNPFDNPRFEWDVSFFGLLRPVFDLYGAGDFTFFFRLRDKDGKSHLKKLGTVGIRKEPLLKIYNHSMSVRMEASDTVTGEQNGFIGPLHYHNRYDDVQPSRNKRDFIRGAQVNDNLGDDNWTVVRVYRLDIDRREAATFSTLLKIVDDANSVNAQVKAVHRDFLDFGATDPDNDDNWRAVGESLVRETTVERLEVASDTVAINTFTDEDGIVKTRGEKELSGASVAGQGAFTESDEVAETTPMSELDYFALLAQVDGGNAAVDLFEFATNQIW